MKRKGISTRAFQGMERRITRLQAKAQMDSQHSSSTKSSSLNANFPTPCVSLSSSKRFKEPENVDIPELEKSGNESIPTTLKYRRWLRGSDQNSSSNTSAELYATIDNFIGTVLSPVQAEFPTAPSRCVLKNALVGDKTKECYNTRLAGTSVETNSVSAGTFNTENFNSKLVAQNQRRKERDRDAFPVVTAKDISGAAITTIASNTTLARKVALEEARVISNVLKEMPKDVNNSKTMDEPLRPTSTIGLSEMADMFADDDSNEDEVQSSFDPTLVSVQGYRVKEASAHILKNVMEKHGDIAMNCFVKTVKSRSFFLEQICEIIQTLQTKKFVDIAETEVKKMLEMVGDLERVNLDVGWLQKRLEEIFEVQEVIMQYKQLKKNRERNAQIVQESKKALKSYEYQIQALKEKASMEKEKMDAVWAEDRSVMQRVSNLNPKLQRFIKESLLHDLQ